ncbi:MAG: RidA family protein [Planctomycetota bacterium]|nr:RidA family protein [Planctomycetota bacterium]MDW8373661.1 RidA family protein [Planctomycetota bacterium]
MRRAIFTAHAPAAIGPYSQAVVCGDLLWCSGQLGVDPATGQLVEGDAAAQAEQCLRNLAAICEAAGASLQQAVRCTVYLTDIADFAAVNAVYARWFSEPYPARATVQVAALPRGARIEIDAVVALRSGVQDRP